MMIRKLAISSLALVGICATAHADYIVNGQFAAPGITPTNGAWSTFSTIDGWYSQLDSATGTNNPIEVGAPSNYGISNTVGNNLELNSNGPSQVSQDIAGLNAGQVLNISFLDGYRADPSNPNTNTNGFNVLWNGNLVQSYLPTSPVMSLQSLTVTAQSGVNTLTFQSTCPIPSSSYGGEIEDVVATPEPGSFAVVGLGCGLLGLIRRKRS